MKKGLEIYKKKLIMLFFILPIILFSVPLNESFTSITFPPIGWRVINNDGGQQVWGRDTNNPRTEPGCASSRYESNTLRNDDWMITPKLICSPTTADTLKFWYRKAGGGNPESLEVWLSNTTNNINDFTIQLWKRQFTTTTYAQKIIPLDTFDGQEIYIAFVNKGLYGNRINLDDITGPEMVEICDVGVDSVIYPLSAFVIRPVGAGFSPQAKITNYSNATQRNIPIVCSIIGQSSILHYQNTKYVDSLLVDSSRIITFDLFTPNIAELCTIKVSTFLANDTNVTNNTKIRTTQIICGQYTGGPDDGFYYWIDSDTTSGLIYNWTDISLSGTPLVSGDAYVAGPIPIGFPFNYYGETKPYFWYSTNGFITLDEISLSYNTNSNIPSTNLPNSLIAPFWDDLYTYQARHQTFGSTPNRYKIVQWKSIVYSQAVLRDTVIFQVILHENGDILYQYNYCSNRYNLGQGQSATVGIENSSGTSGLQYLFDGVVQGNLLSSGRVIKFYRSCHDVTLDTILTGYVGISDTIFPKAVVKNIGTFAETFSTVLNIRNNAQTLIYADTLEVVNLPPTAKCTLEFKRWIPIQFGTYPAKAWTTLIDDAYLLNDTCVQDIVVTLAAPILLSPSNGHITNNPSVLFDWTDVFQASRYNIQIDGIIDTVLNWSQYGPKIFNQGSFTWRVRAGNYDTWGLWSETYGFAIDTTPPPAPILISPVHNCTLFLPRPSFIWHQVNDAAQYNILIYSSYDTVINQTISDSNYTPIQAIPNGRFFWKVRSRDFAGNWSDFSQVRTLTLQYQVWYQKSDMPEPGSYKPINLGGALVAASNRIYALKGNNTRDFYSYDASSDQWNIEQEIPFLDLDSVIIKRKVKAGGALVYGNGNIFAIKGNNTKEFWEYNLLQDSWMSRKPIRSIKSLRGGSCLTYYNGAVYCLVGSSSKFEFFRYVIQEDSWSKLNSAPAGRFNKRFKDGSCMTCAGNGKMYVLKGGSRLNEFYCYDIASDAWQEKESLPYFHPLIRKKTRVKSGGAMAYDGLNSIYALKGGGKNEFWQYDITNGQWFGLETIPKSNRRSVPKAGASLAFLDSQIWLLKGNKTREFWSYQASLDKLYHRFTPHLLTGEAGMIQNYDSLSEFDPTKGAGEPKTQKNTAEVLCFTLNNKNFFVQKLIHNGTSKSANLNFQITNPGYYVFNFYDLNGRVVQEFDKMVFSPGKFEQRFSLDNLPNGVYFVVIAQCH